MFIKDFFSVYFMRCCLWWWWRWRNNTWFVARSMLDCYKFVLWRKRPCSTTVGFIWWVYSDVCSKNCWRFTRDWTTGRITAHVCGYWRAGILSVIISLYQSDLLYTYYFCFLAQVYFEIWANLLVKTHTLGERWCSNSHDA